MKRILWLCLALAAFAALPRPAHAGRVWAWAEDAVFPSDSANCSKIDYAQATRSYTLVRCTAAGTTSKFHLRLQMPPDMPNNGPTAKFHIQTNTGVTGDCTWEVSLVALPLNSSLASGIVGGTYQASAATTFATAETRKISAATSAIAIKDLQTGSTCASTTCLQQEVVAIVRLNAKTATSCDFRMLELAY